MIATRVVFGALPIAAAAAGLALLHVSAHDYLLHQGFPLDDAWIHAVYAREFARSFHLAYNPGISATGETSPLWALLLAVPHAFTSGQTVVVLSKLLGFALHAASALVVAKAVADANDRQPWIAVASGVLVALHPDLLAASVSGMEVPLATLVIAATALATVRGRTGALVGLGFVSYLARPETAVVVVLLPLLFDARRRPIVAVVRSMAAFVGGAAAVAAVAVRNWIVSGRPLPATFYAKTNAAATLDMASQRLGFENLFGQIPVLDLPGVIVLLGLAAAILCVTAYRPIAKLAGSLFLCGLVLCATSFALIRPIDPYAFYHQRYILPALLPLLAALPLVAGESAALIRPSWQWPTAGVAATLAAVLMLRAGPARYQHLANDARNIDDVQVQFGRALAAASPSDVAWVVDAGAARYFGNATVVDLMGLNTFEMLGAGAHSFLDAHPPRYLDRFPGWSSIGFDADAPTERTFSTSTRYTVTSFSTMQQHALVTCAPANSGVIDVKGRRFMFRCARN